MYRSYKTKNISKKLYFLFRNFLHVLTGPPPPAYGAPPPQQGYGAPPPQQGYAAPPPQQGYGAPPPQQGYGAPPPMQGYAQPAHGAQPPYGYAQPAPGFGPPGNYLFVNNSKHFISYVMALSLFVCRQNGFHVIT